MITNLQLEVDALMAQIAALSKPYDWLYDDELSPLYVSVLQRSQWTVLPDIDIARNGRAVEIEGGHDFDLTVVGKPTHMEVRDVSFGDITAGSVPEIEAEYLWGSSLHAAEARDVYLASLVNSTAYVGRLYGDADIDGDGYTFTAGYAEGAHIYAQGDGAVTVFGGDTDVVGGSGNQVIQTGAGDDYLHGGAGNDSLSAGAGNDVLSGGTGDDTLLGGNGNDHLYGGDGNDALGGGDGGDFISGGNGNDAIVSGLGNDTVYGGSGSDTFVFDLAPGESKYADAGWGDGDADLFILNNLGQGGHMYLSGLGDEDAVVGFLPNGQFVDVSPLLVAADGQLALGETSIFVDDFFGKG